MMLKLEEQICTLEQAKRLKELGVKRESLFYHSTEARNVIVKTMLGYTTLGCESPSGAPDFWEEESEDIYSAFTVAELGDILSKVRYESYGFPLMFTSYSYLYDEMHNIFGKWSCNYRNPRDFTNPEIKTETEAQARAAMLIFLLEEGILKLE